MLTFKLSNVNDITYEYVLPETTIHQQSTCEALLSEAPHQAIALASYDQGGPNIQHPLQLQMKQSEKERALFFCLLTIQASIL